MLLAHTFVELHGQLRKLHLIYLRRTHDSWTKCIEQLLTINTNIPTT